MSNKQNGEIVCQRCQHKNEAGALKCAWCGAPLTSDTTTMRVTESLAETRAVYAPRPGMLTDGLSLYIAGEIRPLTIRGREKFILGRHTSDDASIIIDLTPYNAGVLGVSRRHAMITFADETYTLEDLGSTNGTWLNEKQLPAQTPFILRNGDQIRLGQLILFVYFSSQPVRQTIMLKDKQVQSADDQPFTPHYLAASVSPYLKAIIGIQYVIDELNERTPARVEIESINVNARDALISVSLGGAREAIELVHDEINPWKRKYASMIDRLQALGRVQTDMEEVELEKEKLFQELREGQIELARTLIRIFKESALAGNNSTFVEQLLPHLHTLAMSTLEIFTNRENSMEGDRLTTNL